MKGSIGRRYTLWFIAVSLLILFSVMMATIIVLSRSSDLLREKLREGTSGNFAAFEQTMMYNLSDFLRRELFTPLYQLDIERIDRTLKDLRKGMPVKSIRVADASGRVLTDGTDANPSYGTELLLDRDRLASTPVWVEPTGEGHRITFPIGMDEYLVGYGEITYSEEPIRKAVALQEETVLQIWHDFRKDFLRIAVGWTAIIAFFSVVISFFLSRTLTQPLISLRDATGRIAAGDLEHRLEIDLRDEVGELAAAFNRMSENLQETQAKLTTAKNLAEAANATKSEFLANMSHEMRTPLAGAMGMMDIVLKMNIDDEARKLLKVARRSADTLLRFISDLLDYSRLEAGMMTFEDKEFFVPGVVGTAVEVVAAIAKEKKLKLSWKVDEAVPPILHGDEGRLRQVLINLLGNSVKFTRRGEIEATVCRSRDSEAGGQEVLLFSVRDTGVGIPSDQIGRIFHKFTQVDSSMTRRQGGAGLGLALSKQIVEKIGGKIWVESRLGVGSTFYFTHPLRGPDRSDGTSPSTSI